MGENDQKLVMVSDDNYGTVIIIQFEQVGEVPPPPVYQQQVTPLPKYAMDTPTPLPTYAQSEKFENEGVLVEVSSSDEETPEDYPVIRRESGSCFEFILFFTGKIIASMDVRLL